MLEVACGSKSYMVQGGGCMEENHVNDGVVRRQCGGKICMVLEKGWG